MNSFLYGVYILLGLMNPENERARIIGSFAAGKKPASAVIAYTAEARPIRIFYYPGTSDSNALVVGGIHGSELSATSLAWQIIGQLDAGLKPRYNTWVIPSLFPDNAADAAAVPAEIGSIKNIGRLTHPTANDPNRQMPAPGTAFSREHPLDNTGRLIEMENRLLLELVQQLKPTRIAMLHAIRDTALAGIFADPRTDCESIALGNGTDSSIALQTATMITSLGGNARGNQLATVPSTRYYLDPAIAAAGSKQLRNLKAGPAGFGISMGTWGSTAVCKGEDRSYRDASILFTVEFPGSRRPGDYFRPDDSRNCERNMEAYASALCVVFLNCSVPEGD